MEEATIGAKRTQNRNTEAFDPSISSYYQKNFKNEPDTDWSLAANRKWAKSIRNTWRKSTSDAPIQIPIVINGKDIFDDRKILEAVDPSQHDQKICVARFALANETDVNTAVTTAEKDPDGWRKKPYNSAIRSFPE